MIKICHLSSVHIYQDTRILYKECSSLGKKYDTHLIAVNDVPKIINNVKVHPFPKFKSRFLRIIFAPLIMLFKARQINAEVYHIHDPELILTAIILKILFKKKIVFDVHEHIKKHFHSKPYHIPSFVLKLITFAYSFIENHLLNKFDLIVTATPLIKEEIIAFNKNVIAINNYPIIEEVKLQEEKIKESNSVCYVGAITEDRGIKIILNVLSLNDKFKLKLVGKFVSQELESEVKNMNSWDKVEYYGFKNRQEIYKIMNESFAGLIVLKKIYNYANSFPNKMFEYMLAGIPIIASDFPLWKKILKDVDCAIFVNPENPEDIMNAIIYLKDNPEIAKRMGKAGQEKVLKDYNWNSEERNLFEKYQELIGVDK